MNDLLRRYRDDGDAAAMEELVRKTRPRLLAAARRIGQPQDAEDSVQATYHALLRRGERPMDAPVLAWLLTVVVRIAYRRKAIQQREPQLADQLALPSDELGPGGRAVVQERAEYLRAEVARLPDLYRDAVVLRYFEGLSLRECAQLLDLPDATVRTRLKRARRLLRGRLHPRIAHLGLVVPWWMADVSRASVPTIGVVMKSKAVMVTVLLAAAALLWIGWDAWREGDEGMSRRDAAARRHLRGGTAEGTPEESNGSGPRLPAAIDLAAVDRERDVHGRVVREDGTPVAGARLRLAEFPWRRVSLPVGEQRDKRIDGPETRSARDGTFRLPWDRARSGSLEVSATGLARRRIPNVMAGERLRVVLGSGATLQVRVRDARGRPVEGAEIRLWRDARDAANSLPRVGATAVDGGVTFGGVNGPGQVWMFAWHPERGGAGRGRRVFVSASSGRVDLEFVIPPGEMISGRVLSKGDGEPIVGARVGFGWGQSWAVRTDESGRYRIAKSESDADGALFASHPDFAVECQLVSVRTQIDFELSPGDRVQGRVLGADGAPLEGVRIAAIGAVMRRLGPVRLQQVSHASGTSGSDGRFELGGLHPRMFHSVVLVARGHGRVLFDIEPTGNPGGCVDLADIRLAAGFSVEGRVLDEEGTPLARVPVTLGGANADRRRYEPRAAGRNMHFGEREFRRTDDLGRFRFPELAPGTYTLVSSRPGGLRSQQQVEVRDGDVRGLTLEFPRSRRVVVSVRDDLERPVTSAYVATVDDKHRVGGSVDANGRVELEVPAGVRAIRLRHAGHPTEGEAYRIPYPELSIPEDGDEVEFRVVRVPTIRGTVRRPDGTPIPQALVAARHEGKLGDPVSTDLRGQFRLPVSPGKTFDLVYQVGQRGDRPKELMRLRGELRDIAAGSRNVQFVLQKVSEDRTLVVRVLDPEGEPLEGRVVRMSGAMFAVATTDHTGRARFSGLLQTEFNLFVSPLADEPGLMVPPRLLPVVPNGQEVVLRFRPAVKRVGRVIGASKAYVSLYGKVAGKTVSLATTHSDASGRFRLLVAQEDAAGPFRLVAHTVGRKPPLLVERDGVTFLDEVVLRFEPSK